MFGSEKDPATVKCKIMVSDKVLNKLYTDGMSKFMKKNKGLKLKKNPSAQRAWQEYAKHSGQMFDYLENKIKDFRTKCFYLNVELSKLRLDDCKKILYKSRKIKKRLNSFDDDKRNLEDNIKFVRSENDKATKCLKENEEEMGKMNIKKEQYEKNQRVLDALEKFKSAKNRYDLESTIALNCNDKTYSDEIRNIISTTEEFVIKFSSLKNTCKLDKAKKLLKIQLISAYFGAKGKDTSAKEEALKNLINNSMDLSDMQKTNTIKKVKDVTTAYNLLDEEIRKFQKEQNQDFGTLKKTFKTNQYHEILEKLRNTRNFEEFNQFVEGKKSELRFGTGEIPTLSKNFENKFDELFNAQLESDSINLFPFQNVDVDAKFFENSLMEYVENLQNLDQRRKRMIITTLKSIKAEWENLKSKSEKQIGVLSKEVQDRKQFEENYQNTEKTIEILKSFIKLTEEVGNWKTFRKEDKQIIKEYEKKFSANGLLDKCKKIYNVKNIGSDKNVNLERKRVEYINQLIKNQPLSMRVDELRKEIYEIISGLIEKSSGAVKDAPSDIDKKIKEVITFEKAKNELNAEKNNVFVVAKCNEVLLGKYIDSNAKELKEGAVGEQLRWESKKEFDELFDKYIITNKN